MNERMSKRSILRKTFQFGGLTLISRFLGIAREMLTVRLFGFGAISDAFITAFRIPNSLRKVFAEGALTSAFVPSFIKTVKEDGKPRANKLMTTAMIFFQLVLLLLSILVFICPRFVVSLLASGFSEEQFSYATKFVRILFPFIFLISASTLLSAALQAVNSFFMIAFAPIILNIVFLASLTVCLYFKLPLWVYCIGILIGGILQFFCYLFVYFKHGYSFARIDEQSISDFKKVIKKFGNCLFAVSVIEINIWIDCNVASYLETGSISAINYGTTFMRIPLGLFAIGFATVLLTHLSRTVIYAPKRLSFYLLESTKLNFWVSIPASVFLIFVSEKLFSTLLLSNSGMSAQITRASWVLTIFALGIVFFSWNRVLTNIFYSFHDTWTPTYIAICATLVNFSFNMISLFTFGKFAIYGIAMSTVLSGLATSILSFWFLHEKHKASLHLKRFGIFLLKALFQLLVGFTFFYMTYLAIFHLLENCRFFNFFSIGFGYWFIVCPLCLLLFLFLFFTRKSFGLKIYFLDR